MNSAFLYFSFVFLLSATSIYAGYCKDRHPKPGQGTCNGTGTSDMAELMKYLLEGRTQYFIAGSCEGIYGIWGFNYKCKPGKEAKGELYKVFAYVVEMPNKNNTQRLYYAITVTDCPTMSKIDYSTRGYVPRTSIPWWVVVKVVGNTCNGFYPGKCNVIPSTRTYPDNFEAGVDMFMSNMISLRAVDMTGQDDFRPKAVAEEHGLAIEQTRCGCTYMQDGYSSVGKNECKDPNPMSPTIGRRLCDDGYTEMTTYDGAGVLCSLVVRLATIYASVPQSCYHSLVTGYVIEPPYDNFYQLKLLLPSSTTYYMNKKLFGCC